MEANRKRLDTEVKIQRAFIQLINAEGFERLTVQQLTHLAGINRGTFYLHYLDKFDLLIHYEDGMLGEIAGIFQHYPKPTVDDSPEHNAFWELFHVLYRERDLAVALLKSADSSLDARVKALIVQVIGRPITTAVPAAYAQEIVAQGILDFFNYWLTRTPVDLTERAYQIFCVSRSLAPEQLVLSDVKGRTTKDG